MLGNLYRIGIAVKNLDEAVARMEHVLGLQVQERAVNEIQKVSWAWLPMGDSILELIAPTAPDSRVARFLEQRGEGLYLLGVSVENLEQATTRLAQAGVEVLYPEPKPFPGGRKQNFIHPRDLHGVLLELIED